MSAYDDLVAQATAALDECDHKISAAKARIEELKQEIVGLQLERRKIAALIPAATPARATRSAGAPASVTGGAFVCAECDRSFVSAQGLTLHGTRSGHATGYVKGHRPNVVSAPAEPAVALVEAGGTTAQAMLAAEDIPDDPSQLVTSSDEVVADVLAYWDELTDLLPLDRVAKIAGLVRISKAEVRSIVHAHEKAVA